MPNHSINSLEAERIAAFRASRKDLGCKPFREADLFDIKVRYVYEKSSTEPDLSHMEAFALTQPSAS
jgi:hypothetical protein